MCWVVASMKRTTRQVDEVLAELFQSIEETGPPFPPQWFANFRGTFAHNYVISALSEAGISWKIHQSHPKRFTDAQTKPYGLKHF